MIIVCHAPLGAHESEREETRDPHVSERAKSVNAFDENHRINGALRG